MAELTNLETKLGVMGAKNYARRFLEVIAAHRAQPAWWVESRAARAQAPAKWPTRHAATNSESGEEFGVAQQKSSTTFRRGSIASHAR